MAGRLTGALVVVLALVVAFRFSFTDLQTRNSYEIGLVGQPAIVVVSDPSVLGIKAFGNHPKFPPGSHPGRGRGPEHKLTPTTQTPSTTIAPGTSTTLAPTSTASTTTTAPVTTTTAPVTTTSAATTTTQAATTTSSAAGAPAGAVVIQAGANIQSVVSAKPAGSTFYLLAGTYSGQEVTPRNGDTFIGQPGAILNGNGSQDRAFKSGATNVTITGLVIENYANEAQSGAVGGGGGSNWSIIGNEIRYNWGGGVVLDDGFVVRGNYIHHNRQIGIKGGGSNVLIEANEVAHNNYLDEYSMSWESGGAKFLKTVDLVVRGNYVHDNHGHGLWTDADNIGTLYENNVVINNYGSGIFHEISYDAIIRYNQVEGNSFPHTAGGIKIADSSNVEVYGNTLAGNDGGFNVTQNDRGGGAYGAYEVRNLWIHDNAVSFGAGTTGLVVSSGGDVYFTGKNNRFEGNDYWISGIAEPFKWVGGSMSWSDWNAFGLDLSGSMG